MYTADILNKASNTFTQRGQEYGSVNTSFTRASIIASAMLDRAISPYEIAVVMMAIKQARIANNPKSNDSYVDLSVYSAIASELASQTTMPEAKMMSAIEAELNRSMAESNVSN